MAKKKRKQKTRAAFSLVELLVVLVIIASLIALAIPGIKAMQKSFGSTGAEGMISAALATARTLAMSRQQYAGVRFQKEYSAKGPLEANQYMIFVIFEEPAKMDNLTVGFRAIEGYKPVKLPENTGVMDMKLDSADITSDGQINDEAELTNTTTFSIVFSPAGKLVIHDVRTRNKKGKYMPSDPNESGYDDVFNSLENIVNNNTGQFIQDDYSSLGLDKEQSRSKFVIYDCEKFSKLDFNKRYQEYLKDLEEQHTIYVNAYTGEIIKD